MHWQVSRHKHAEGLPQRPRLKVFHFTLPAVPWAWGLFSLWCRSCCWDEEQLPMTVSLPTGYPCCRRWVWKLPHKYSCCLEMEAQAKLFNSVLRKPVSQTCRVTAVMWLSVEAGPTSFCHSTEHSFCVPAKTSPTIIFPAKKPPSLNTLVASLFIASGHSELLIILTFGSHPFESSE